MQTNIADKFKQHPRVDEAERILRRCVHCGFCLATCPTYNLLGDELDGPRGRIYLIKQVLEGEKPTAATQQHLDRCLTCRNCETTCPSGVEYGHLVDIGRGIVEQEVSRDFKSRCLRRLVLTILPKPERIAPLVKLGQRVRWLLPHSLRRKVPTDRAAGVIPEQQHTRKMIMPQGCVQPSMAPSTDAAAMRVLNHLGIQIISPGPASCCGAIHYHLNEQPASLGIMRQNIDAWWPAIEAGAEAIVTTASGCGVMLKDYAHALVNDAEYSAKAARVSELAVDIAELLAAEDLSVLQSKARPATQKVAYHPPCTLQHGQQLPDISENILRQFGFTLTPVPDSHECCGSAGTYSLFQPELSSTLQQKKVDALEAGEPDVIATANIGCQLHIQSASDLEVKHWIELLDDVLAE